MNEASAATDNRKTEEMRSKTVSILESKKAIDISVIDIRHITILTDYFIVCTGTSTVHIRTLADELEEKMAQEGYKCTHREGYDTARWILLDFGEIIVHVFHEDERQFYSLERLWADGKIEIIRSQQQ